MIIVLIVIILVAIFPCSVQSQKSATKLRVAGTRLTSVRVVTAGCIADITDWFMKNSYSREKDFVFEMEHLIRKSQADKSLVFEIDTASRNTRIYKPGQHPPLLGLSYPKKKKRVVRKAYIESHKFLGSLRDDVTHRVDQCAGPNNDFYAVVGGLVTPYDVLCMYISFFWKALYIEWMDGRPTSSFMLKDDDVITICGKMYPRVDPYVPVQIPAKRTKSFFKKILSFF